jgi:ubiquinone/menaquinone biosynthesis C-methylase UbiE
MKSSKERIYDNVYGRANIRYEASGGLIGFLYKKFSRYEVSRYQAVFNLLPSVEDRLLDLGCGDGDFIFMAKDRFSECYGVDVSSMRVQKAKCRLKEMRNEEKLHFCNCDIDDRLPFSDSFFDVATCIAVLEHAFNPPSTVEEIYRVLKPDGIFVIQVPNIAWLPARLQLLFGKLPTTGGVYSGADWEHLHNFTKSILCGLLEEKGFKIQNISCSGIFANHRKQWVSVLGGDLVVRSIKDRNYLFKKKRNVKLATTIGDLRATNDCCKDT